MNLKEYENKASRTLANLNDPILDNIHMSLGLVTEASEIADVFKKKIAYNKDVDWINVKEEIGDLMWYVSNMCFLNGWNLEEILDTNIKKLESRYPEKFTTENAITRNLEQERKILES